MSEPREFDIRGPLPDGITVLEASAGTGKTYTIASLAARYVADGIDLERILLVSFTRMAAGDLRLRVRERMLEIERGLATVAAGGGSDDPVVGLLAAGDMRRARARLAHAISSFDSATIVTTHSFCQEVLGGLGIAGDLERDSRFVEDLSPLATEVLDDLYVRKYRDPAATPLRFDHAEAIVRRAITTPTAAIDRPRDGGYDERARLADAAREELERRKRRLGVMSYDDLVGRLRDALSGAGGEAARALLRRRFDVALVDEFQDTDPDQWEVLREGFGQPGQTLVLIADPKQAIYAFRGADVYAYLDATRTASDQRTLPINWRSDQPLLDALDALFANAQLGHPGIVYRHVRAEPDHAHSRLSGAPHPEPMRVRVAMRESPEIEQTARGYAGAPSATRFIADDLAADVAQLLGSGAQVDGEPVCPEHIAVLVRTHAQAEIVQGALQAAGVPAVVGGAGSVFVSEAARHWLRLIEALERPASVPRAHSAALTDFVGWSAARLAAAGDADGDREWEDMHRRLHEWARILRGRGVASLLETITASEDLAARVLADADGERRLTDLRHVAQLLHAAATADSLGPTALAGWLRARIDEEAGDEERTRRLESDEQAVQILTIHRAKGLEFGIVYVPFLWERRDYDDRGPIAYHDGSGRFMLDVSTGGGDRRAHARQGLTEERGEDLRLAYVALTRARHQVVVWWAGAWNSRIAPLTRLLLARDDAGVVAPATGPGRGSVPDDATMLARLQSIRSAAPEGAIAVEHARPLAGARWSPAAPPTTDLSASRFERTLDLRWRRTSYTDITAASYEASVASEPEEPLLDDEPGTEEPLPAIGRTAEPELSSPALLGEMPVGADVGTFVHGVMEACDFAAGDLDGELRTRIAQVRRVRAVDIGDPALVAEGLAAVIATPLGDALGGRALRDLARGDRLDELGFELPLAGGDRPGGWVTVDAIADVLRDELGGLDPLSGYAARLAGDPFLRRSVRGYLTGSLDLVARFADRAGATRYAVLDYKTNWLGEPGEPLTAYHYRPDALLAEMHRHHYALQALLYTVALHRYLRWRVTDYDPDVHLAGVAYLFVRGMTGGPGIDGTVPGVFSWRPPPGLVAALSAALAEGEA